MSRCMHCIIEGCDQRGVWTRAVLPAILVMSRRRILDVICLLSHTSDEQGLVFLIENHAQR